MKKFLVSFLILIVLHNADTLFAQNWQKVNGTNPYINKIFSPVDEPNRIIVASDGNPTDILLSEIDFPLVGSGCQESSDYGNVFNKYFLTGYPVYDIYASKKNPNNWVAAVRKFDRGGILHSTDKGANWNDFLSCDGTNQIYRISSTIVDGNELFVAGAIETSEGFVYSDDGFSTCQSSSALSVEARSIAYSKLNPNMLFIAGDAYSQGRVLRSKDNGKTWFKEDSGLEGLRILSVLPSSHNEAVVLCGADSLTSNKSSIGKGIYLSLDTGKTWQRIAGFGAQVFEIAEHPTNPKYIAAAAGLQGVLVSSINGYWFEQHNSGLPEGKSVRNVMIPNWETNEQGFITFAGVYNDGLYKSGYLTTDVNNIQPIEFSMVSVSPQPASDVVSFVWNNPNAEVCDITIFDSFGRDVYSMSGVAFPEGQNNFNWNISNGNHANGMYFISISSASGRLFNKFIVNK